MKKNNLFVLLLAFFAMTGCSGSDDTAASTQTSKDTTAEEKPAENQYLKAQLDTINTSKSATNSAQEAINKQQEALQAIGQ